MQQWEMARCLSDIELPETFLFKKNVFVMFPAQNNRQLPAEQPLFFDDFITRNNWKAAQENFQMQLNLMPATNVYETEKAFYIELVVPGLSHEDLLFFTTENGIEIRYQPDEHNFEPYGSRRYLHREYRPAAFQRAFQVNTEALDFENIHIDSAKGVVRIEVPKQENYWGTLPLRVPFSLN